MFGGVLVAACSSTGGGDTGADAGVDSGADASVVAPGVEAGPPAACTKGAECPSGVCSPGGLCAAPTPTDGVRNADETDIDCGGASAPKCDVRKECAVGGDCVSGVCADEGKGLQCQPATSDDGVKNGDETDVDCGGAKAPKCADGKVCKGRSDCASDVCPAGLCANAVCDDLAKNGTETDVDCGGPACPRCADTLTCTTADDCTSGVCTGGKCQVPSPTDNVKNGDETDVDCGGSAPKCATGKICEIHADCASDGCNYEGKCALRRSCTGHYGGDTCGAGGTGGIGPAAWESCCATAPAGVGGVAMDKNKITSGRMRAFLTRVKGDVRKAIRELRAAGEIPTIPGDPAHLVLEDDWDLYLPTAMDGCDQTGTCDLHPDGKGGTDLELSDYFYDDASQTPFKGIYTSAYRHVGGSLWRGQNQGLQGCAVGSPGTHSYWMDKTTQSNYFGDIEAEYDQTVYDAKILNCTEHLMLQAFCVWDGGRLETQAEWKAAIGPDAYPWGNSPAPKEVGSSQSTNDRYPQAITFGGVSIAYANYHYSYEWPQLKTSDYIVFISAPGRLPNGYGPWGHADLAGVVFENLSNVSWNAIPRSAEAWWARPGTWEVHPYSKNTPRKSDSVMDKYGKTGGRCVYP